MIIIDTNVLSEFARTVPTVQVISWFERQNTNELWTTAVTEAEMLMGLALMPEGKRRNELATTIEKVLDGFEHRILAFDRDAARQMPAIVIGRRAARLQTKDADGQIAAIARAHGAAVATRNTVDFTHCGVEVVNPWST